MAQIIEMHDSQDNPKPGRQQARRRKPYAAPALEPLGRLREVTASGSATANEPGSNPGKGANPNTQKRRP